MNVDAIGIVPLASFPFPYKYLIAVGFYFYIKHQLDVKHQLISKIEYGLFLPAFIYGLLRTYWYVTMHSGVDKAIFFKVYQSGFFVYNDIVYLIFNLWVTLSAMAFLKKYQEQIKGSISKVKNWNWLMRYTWGFIVFIVLNLIHQIVANSFNLEYSADFYYVILVLNSIYIYWIGFIGFTKSNMLFKTYELKDVQTENTLETKLRHVIEDEEVYTNQNLKVLDLAKRLEISEKELSTYIHEAYGLSFTDYINRYRIEKVKSLLNTPDQHKYTLLAISEKAGFNSKSSFNAVFKKHSGMTPSQYKNQHLKK